VLFLPDYKSGDQGSGSQILTNSYLLVGICNPVLKQRPVSQILTNSYLLVGICNPVFKTKASITDPDQRATAIG